MKIRSGLLVACMIIVPLLAMFSHHIPRSFAGAAGELAWDLVESRLASLMGTAGPEVNGSRTAPAREPAPQKPVAAHTSGWTAANGVVAESPAAPPRTASTPAADELAAAVDGRVPPTGSATLPTGAAGAVTGRLADLGAIDIECHPEPGAAGRHRATCRIPVDAAGQLHRVFQATGPNRSAAERNLLAEVMARKHRMATLPPGAGAAVVGPPRPSGTAF